MHHQYQYYIFLIYSTFQDVHKQISALIQMAVVEAYQCAQSAMESVINQSLKRAQNVQEVFRSNLKTWASTYFTQLLQSQSKLRCQTINKQGPNFSQAQEAVNCQTKSHVKIERVNNRRLSVQSGIKWTTQNEPEVNKMYKSSKSRRKLSAQKQQQTNIKPSVRLQTAILPQQHQYTQTHQIRQLRFQKEQQQLSLKSTPITRRTNAYSQYRVASRKQLHSQQKQNNKLPFNVNHLQVQFGNQKRAKDKTILNAPKNLNLIIKNKQKDKKDNAQNCETNKENEVLEKSSIKNGPIFNVQNINKIYQQLSRNCSISINKKVEAQCKDVQFQRHRKGRALTLPILTPADHTPVNSNPSNISRKVSHHNLFSLIPAPKISSLNQIVSDHVEYPRSMNQKSIKVNSQKSGFYESNIKKCTPKLRLFKDSTSLSKIHVHNFKQLYRIIYGTERSQCAQ